jgi:hypothetical protein
MAEAYSDKTEEAIWQRGVATLPCGHIFAAGRYAPGFA